VGDVESRKNAAEVDVAGRSWSGHDASAGGSTRTTSRQTSTVLAESAPAESEPDDALD
jgi:hypothetical protein